MEFLDVDAIVASYPRVPRSLRTRRQYRDADAISGGTWEALERVLHRAGYYRNTGMPKIEVAQRIAKEMDPSRNRSRSFAIFRDGLAALTAVHSIPENGQ